MLSVVMPVKNALPYLDDAVESILTQTHKEFEFIILDDGSHDGSLDRLHRWGARDSRIRIIEGGESRGPAESSNAVTAQARTPIIARMDADDVAHPDRLRRQMQILHRHRDAVLVGSVWEGIDREGRVVREADLSTLGRTGFSVPYSHGSIMFRREAFEQAGGYRHACRFWEDLDLFIRMAGVGRVLVIPQPLYRYRFSETSTRLTSHRLEVEQAVDLMFRCRSAFEGGEDYSALLTPPGPSVPHLKLHPYTLLSLGNIALWSGIRSLTLQGLLERGNLRFDAVTMKAFVWAVWAALSPSSLRFVLRLLLTRRNKRAKARLTGVEVCEWRPRPVAAVAAPVLISGHEPAFVRHPAKAPAKSS